MFFHQYQREHGNKFNRQFDISHRSQALENGEVRKANRLAKKGSNVIASIDHLNSFAFHFSSLSTHSESKHKPKTIWLMELMNLPVKSNARTDRELLFIVAFRMKTKARKKEKVLFFSRFLNFHAKNKLFA